MLHSKCRQTSFGFANDIALQMENEHTKKVDTGTQHVIENNDVL